MKMEDEEIEQPPLEIAPLEPEPPDPVPERSPWPYVQLGLVALWLVAVGVEARQFAHAFWGFRHGNNQLEYLARELSSVSADTVTLEKTISAQSREIEFLQGLVNVLPQERGFVRTQAAMADEVENLRAKVGRKVHNDLHVVVDTKANKLYVKRGLRLLWAADCSVGRGGILRDRVTGRKWEFVTPRGQFDVLDKIEKPIWTKPDWAFVETGEAVPPPEDAKRKAEGELGAYVLNLGDGYLIHGTKNEALLGRPVSHGCVRLGADDLKKLYETVPRGARVYIY